MGGPGQHYVPPTQAAKSPADHPKAAPNPPPAIKPAFLFLFRVQIRPKLPRNDHSWTLGIYSSPQATQSPVARRDNHHPRLLSPIASVERHLHSALPHFWPLGENFGIRFEACRGRDCMVHCSIDLLQHFKPRMRHGGWMTNGSLLGDH